MSPVELVDAAMAAVTGLGETDLASVPDETCLEVARALARLGNMVDAQLTRVTGRIHSGGAAAAEGAASTQAWLRSRLHTAHAGAHVRAAKTLAATPLVAAAYTAGEISLAHVMHVATVVADIDPALLAAGVDDLLAAQAHAHPPAVFARAATRIRDHFAPDAAEAKRRHQYGHRWLDVDRTFDGAISLTGLFDPDAGQLLLAALAAATPPATPGELRNAGQRRADALLDLCRTAGTRDPDRAHLVVTSDLTTLQTRLTPTPAPESAADTHADGLARPLPRPPRPADLTGLIRPDGTWTGATMTTHTTTRPDTGSTVGRGGPFARLIATNNTPISPETARRLACDADVTPAVLGARGQPLDLGRTTRWPNTALRKALILRDGCCRFPGCDRPPQWTDAHHLIPWAIGGRTHLPNLVLLCRFHHTLVHEGGYGIRLDPNTGNVHATYPDGRTYDLISQPRACLP